MNFDNSISLIKDTTKILDSEAFAFLTILHSAIDNFKSEIEKSLLADQAYQINGATYIKNITKNINGAIAQISAFEISRLILQVEAKLDEQKADVPENLEAQIRAYIAAIVKFIRDIEVFKFSGANNVQEMYASIINVNIQKSNLLSYKSGIELLKTYIIQESEISPEQAIIELEFHSDENSFQAFAQLAGMVDFLYSEICQILNIPYKSHALKVRMIYSGSVHFSLVGEAKTLSLLEDILKNAGKYFYENYTKSGQFQKLTGNLNELIQQLQLLLRLEALGLNVTEAKEQLEKSLTLIAKAMNENLKHQYKMLINSTEIMIAPSQYRELTHYEPKLIPYRPLDELA